MGKVAKLVLTTFMTRVVVEESATQDEIIAAARPKLELQVNDLGDNIEDIIPDTEFPFNPKTDTAA